MSIFLEARRLLVACMAAGAPLATATAQSLASRIERVRDGEVRLEYAAREGLCGDGEDQVRTGRTTYLLPFNGRYINDRFPGPCYDGPVRVELLREGGETTRLRVHVGGRWRAESRRIEDLEVVSAPDAFRYFLGEAQRLGGRSSDYALAAAVFADSVAATSPLLRIARDDRADHSLREKIVFWIAGIDEPEASTAIRSLITDERLDNDLRGGAIIALARGDITDDDAAFLQRQYATLPERIKTNVFVALARATDPKVGEWMASIVTNDREPQETRKNALFFLGQSRVPLRTLTTLGNRLDGRELRQHYTFVLSQRHEPAAVEALIDIARNDRDREVRRQAFFWLGQSKDERARSFLQEMVLK